MEVLTLYELNQLVAELIQGTLTDAYWVRAELSEIRVSQKGHCFIELVEKDEQNGLLKAKARGVIMRYVYPLLKMNFESITGQPLCAGLNVLLQVRVSFSELYGYSLIVEDIDPTYTLGSIARRRREIMERLQKEGVAEMNQELTFPQPAQRIAVISSPTAAGYEDFCRQLDTNAQGFRFTHQLFAATMQGGATESSIIAALDRIAGQVDQWDVVVIIRGGGAVSDLSGFDTYPLANNVAQFPLPILTGIGHERDLSVLDLVAYHHLKTPTAVADYLIEQMTVLATQLESLEERLTEACRLALETENNQIGRLMMRVEMIGKTLLPQRLMNLDQLDHRLSQAASHQTEIARLAFGQLWQRLKSAAARGVSEQKHHLQALETAVKAADPEHILRLGYSITLKDGKAVRDIALLRRGDHITTRLAKGEVTSTID